MLHAQETFVERGAFAVVDVHTHITVSAKSQNGVALAAERSYLGKPDELLSVMDRKNIRAMVNLTGGYDDGLVEVITNYDKAFPGRFYSLTEPCYSRFLEPNYPRIQADAIERAQPAGAKGLKILKTLGLYLRENITSGRLVKIDDPRFDPMWDTCGQLNMPAGGAQPCISPPSAYSILGRARWEFRREPGRCFGEPQPFPNMTVDIAARIGELGRRP